MMQTLTQKEHNQETKIIYAPLESNISSTYDQLWFQQIFSNPLLFLAALPILPLLLLHRYLQQMQVPQMQQALPLLPMPYKYLVRRIEVVRDNEGRIIRIVDTVESI
jgi:hypothetical protein